MVGDGTAEGSSAIGDGGQAAVSLSFSYIFAETRSNELKKNYLGRLPWQASG